MVVKKVDPRYDTHEQIESHATAGSWFIRKYHYTETSKTECEWCGKRLK